ncbi:MAG: protein kinase [Deltaproteobacteria bacterium]|nr:protein kinase [Deltaproteobacteria bacterium]
MASKKLNCWEYKECGREPGGEKAGEFGICPAASDTSFDGINTGRCAGRFCWAVAGTFCGDSVQGTFAEKRDSCLSCDFFNRVQEEEGTVNLRTKFLNFVTLDDKNPLLSTMTYKYVKQGEQFITQGHVGEEAFIIQRGSCMEIVEKDGELHPVGHRGVGDIVGMMSILTGEPHHMHVEAETDMELWVLDRAQFNNISQKDAGLLNFLTELVADRFDSKRPVADRVIGKYIATDIIGRGGYSLVYKGVHAELNMPVAIKMMRHDLVMNSDILDSFRNEAKIIASLNHENIIRVYDIEERFRTVFIIMEYLDGEALSDMILHLKIIPSMLAADFLTQVCSGLAYAHNKGIIHRDISPLNILVQPDDRIKIIDFGLAGPVGADDWHVGGVLPYMAPELFDGEPGSRQSDIYALGITAFEMVTGKRPYPEDSASLLMKMHRFQDIPDPAKSVVDLSETLRRFIITACRREPLERYQNVSEALEDLSSMVKPITSKYHHPKSLEQKITTLRLSYKDEHQVELARLLKKFSLKVKELGASLKTEDLRDI